MDVCANVPRTQWPGWAKASMSGVSFFWARAGAARQRRLVVFVTYSQ
jgi:hypothetical protein